MAHSLTRNDELPIVWQLRAVAIERPRITPPDRIVIRDDVDTTIDNGCSLQLKDVHTRDNIWSGRDIAVYCTGIGDQLAVSFKGRKVERNLRRVVG
jgi:hypothetical protein